MLKKVAISIIEMLAETIGAGVEASSIAVETERQGAKVEDTFKGQIF